MNPLNTIALAIVWCAGATTLTAQERHQVSGPRVAVYNLAGQVSLEPGGGSAVVVEVTRGGQDAGQLTVEQGAIRGRETLRVIYPDGDIRYPRPGFYGGTDIRVREDGTFGDSNGRERGYREGRRIRISGRRGDVEAYADLRIQVPRGQRIDVYLAVGQLTANNVDGTLYLDGSSADVTTSNTTGDLTVDVGSGSVMVRGATGDVSLDPGSGDVDVSGVRGAQLTIDTGSGSASAASVSTRVLNVDTGSGDIDVTGATAEQVSLDTGSGSVRCEFANGPDRLAVDTGSGSVTLTFPPSYGAAVDVESSSGRIDVDFPVEARRFGRDRLVGTIGDGKGTLKVDTGSGSVTIRKGPAR